MLKFSRLKKEWRGLFTRMRPISSTNHQWGIDDSPMEVSLYKLGVFTKQFLHKYIRYIEFDKGGMTDDSTECQPVCPNCRAVYFINHCRVFVFVIRKNEP